MKDVMLDVVLHKNGLVETDNKPDWKEKMKNEITLLSDTK